MEETKKQTTLLITDKKERQLMAMEIDGDESSNDIMSKSPPSKRVRLDRHSDENQKVEQCSIESMLAVPMEVVFRRVSQYPKQEPRPLLTRAEADCFIKVAFLAQEIDVLVKLAEQSLSQQLSCRIYRKRIDKSTHPFLRPIAPIFTLLARQQKKTLQHVQQNLGQLVSQLSACATTLRQAAEQNWMHSDSLIDAFDQITETVSGQSLAQEKRNLAELEEELCQRIQKIVAMANEQDHSPQTATRRDLDKGGDSDPCKVLFHHKDHKGEATSKTIANLCYSMFPTQQSQSHLIESTQGLGEKDDIRLARTQPAPREEESNSRIQKGSAIKESQNSVGKTSSAAEALAVLAGMKASTATFELSNGEA